MVFGSRTEVNCPMCRQPITQNENIIVNHISHINLSTKNHELVKIIKENDSRFIILTQFNQMIDKFLTMLTKLNISVTDYQTYQTSKKDAQVLILSSEQNAEGINLTMFDKIIIFEPFEDSLYCKEIEKQLIGRIHRIGKKEEVDVYRLITKDTIEEEIYSKMYDTLISCTSNI